MSLSKIRPVRPAVLLALLAALLGVLLAGSSSTAGEARAAAKQGGGCNHANAKPGRVSARKVERAVVCLIKQKRRRHNAGRISGHSKLGKAATRHTRRMTGSGCFAHQCSGEASTGERIRRTGYFRNAKSWSYGEVIGWGKRKRGTPRRMVAAWMRSPGHRSTILNRRFKHIGVGFGAKAPSGARRSGTYTVDFGHRSG